MNNRRRIYFAEQARWFTSQFDADAIAQRARIVADGGEVIDFSAMQSFIRGLKDLGLYGNLLACWDARFGIKKDANAKASKWYDISTINRDAIQNTGSAQAIWQADTGADSKPSILFNGSSTKYTFSTITTDPCTIIIKFKDLRTDDNTRKLLSKSTDDTISIGVQGTNTFSIGSGGAYYFNYTKNLHNALAATYTEQGASDRLNAWINGTYAVGGTYGFKTRSYNTIGAHPYGYYYNGLIDSISILNVDLPIATINTISAL